MSEVRSQAPQCIGMEQALWLALLCLQACLLTTAQSTDSRTAAQQTECTPLHEATIQRENDTDDTAVQRKCRGHPAARGRFGAVGNPTPDLQPLKSGLRRELATVAKPPLSNTQVRREKRQSLKKRKIKKENRRGAISTLSITMDGKKTPAEQLKEIVPKQPGEASTHLTE